MIRWCFFIVLLGMVSCNNNSKNNNENNSNNSNNQNNENNENNITNNQNNTNNLNSGNNINNLNNTNNVNDAGTDVDADIHPDPEWIIAPAVQCTPVGSACSTATSMPGIFADFRKDFFLPYNQYRESGDDPINGGRFQIVTNALVSGTVTAIRLNGINVSDLLQQADIEWYHVWPTTLNAGTPVWFHFHSRNPMWNTTTFGHLTIETTGGIAVDADFPVQISPVRLTYVTVTEDMRTLLIHLKNEDNASHTISHVWVNGADALARSACLPKTRIESQESLFIQAPLCSVAKPGDPWTVVIEYTDGAPSVGSGRIIRPHFVIETWVKKSDCAFPGGNATNFQRHRDAGFDTHYMYWGTPSQCTFSPATVANVDAPALGDFFVLIGDDFLHHSNPETALTNTTAVAGFLTGDESDGEVYDQNGYPNPANKAQQARLLWSMYPDIAVYNGAKTNRNVGSFAGMTDIQGIDFYVAACAPHITAWGFGVPLRGAYDYLLNTRNNHMPLPTWMYAQGLSDVWNKSNFFTTIHVQPDPQEILVQAFSVVAAGGKGLMWFQSSLSEADHAPARWNAISQVNGWIRRIRSFVREGDINQLAVSSDNVIVDQIRSRRALIVPIISLITQNTVSDTDCAMTFTMESMVPHWTLAFATVSVTVEVPEDFGVLEMFEVHANGTSDLAYNINVSGRYITISGIPLDNTIPVRVLVFAADSQVRMEMDAL